MRFVLAGGGTGGHAIPAIALADELVRRGHDVLFIGNDRSIEQSLCEKSAYRFRIIKVQKLYRSLKLRNLLFPYYLITSIIRALSIMKQEKANAVLCTGGFIAGPVAIAACIVRLPLFFHESNSYPGLVTRFLASRITQIYVAFESSRNYLPKADLKNFGIPIKTRENRDFALSMLGLQNDKPTLIVSGGSQGSLAINKIVASVVPEILKRGYQLIWQTGKTTYSSFAPQFQNTPGIHLFAFSPDLPAMLCCADIAITRAGAMTTSELEECRTPSIQIPLPTAAENHQYYNAKEQQNKGVAYLLEQSHLNATTLLAAIDTVSHNLSFYKDNLAKIPPNKATTQIVDDLLKTLASIKRR